MKRMMRVCLILAIMLCLLVAVSISVGAETEYKYIGGVAIACDWPDSLEVGDSLPEVTVSTPDTGPYTAFGYWYEEDAGDVPAGTIVEEGKAYHFYIHVEPEEGYLFDPYIDVWVNSDYPDSYTTPGEENGGFASIGIDKVYAFLTPVEKVEITLFEPVVGQVLKEATAPEGAKYSLSTEWYKNSEDGRTPADGAVAQKDGLYIQGVVASPAKGYMFTQDTEIWINGVQKENPYIEYNYFCAWSEYYNLGDPIDKVEFTFAEPALGQPLPEAKVSADAKYTVGTHWEDPYLDNPDLEPGTITTKTGYYWVCVNVYPKAGYKLTEDTEIWVNGELAEEVFCSVGNGVTEILYSPGPYCFADAISEVHLTYTEPAQGKVLPTPKVTSTGCEVSDWYWYDDIAGEMVEAGTVAQKGHGYELHCTVMVKAGYQFTEATKVYVNNNLILEHLPMEQNLLYYISPRYSFATSVSKVELPAIPELKLGDTLPNSSGTGKNYAYALLTMGVDADGNELSGTKVVEGGAYIVAVAAVPADGYEFTAETKITVGGKEPSGWAEWSAGDFIDYKVYSFGNENAIEKVDLSTQIPGVGEKGGDIKVVNSFHYRVSGVVWGTSKDGTLENFKRMSISGTYQPGQRVMVMIGLGALGDGDYMFVSDLEVTLNGKQYTPIAVLGNPQDIRIVLDLGVAEEKYNGLVVVDGVWRYYEGGIFQEDYTGLVPYGDLIFYVENGILDFTYTGLAWYNDAWTYVANSQLTEGYTGLVWFEGEWFYVVDSVIDWTFTGLVPYEGNYFYVQSNHLDWSYTGLGYHDGGWYFIQNGLLQKEYSGLVYFNDNWFYVEEGVLTYQFFGMVEYQGNLFYVQASHLDWSYTGLGYHEGAWYYFQNALYTPSFTGLVPFNGSLFYVKDGTIDWSFNGSAEYDGTTYTVVNGAVEL